MTIVVRLACVAAALSSSVVLAPEATASCARPPPLPVVLEDAPVVFLGTVVETANADRWATVDVDEVWKGDVSARVEVRAGPKDPPGPLNAASSVDRTFRTGIRYLFVPESATAPYRDSSCTATRRYRSGLGRLRPEDARRSVGPPLEPRGDDASALPWIALAAVVIAAGVAVMRLRPRGS